MRDPLSRHAQGLRALVVPRGLVVLPGLPFPLLVLGPLLLYGVLAELAKKVPQAVPPIRRALKDEKCA